MSVVTAAGRNGQARIPSAASAIWRRRAQGLFDQRPKARTTATAARIRPPRTAARAPTPFQPSAPAATRPEAAQASAPRAQRPARTRTVSGPGTGPRGEATRGAESTVRGFGCVLTCCGGDPARGTKPSGSSLIWVESAADARGAAGGSGPTSSLPTTTVPGDSPARILMMTSPIRRKSPSSRVARSTFRPFRKTPFALPVSRTARPVGPASITAWRLEHLASFRTTSHVGSRPTETRVWVYSTVWVLPVGYRISNFMTEVPDDSRIVSYGPAEF